ncbi:hypothetical protein ACFLXC_05190 [Chloroflexota bacterium]
MNCSKSLLATSVAWGNDLCRPDIEKWLANFKGEVFDAAYERRLALLLLSHFVFYNLREVRHLCWTLFRDYIHAIVVEQLSSQGSGNPIEPDLNSIVYKTSFCALGKPGESGSQVLYYFRQENGVPVRQFSAADKFPTYVENVAFVDDATLSGRQAKDYLSLYRLEKRNVFLLTFLASQDATDILVKLGVHVVSCIKLDSRARCFSNDSPIFLDFNDCFQDCLKFATVYGEKSLLEDSVNCEPLGFGNAGYAFGFFYNVPDNTLSIFWADNHGWSPLIKRYHKKKGVVSYDYGKFI